MEDAAAVGLNIWDQWKINGRVKIPFEMDENLVKGNSIVQPYN